MSVPCGTVPRMDAPFTGSVFLGMSVDGFIARLDGDITWLTGDTEAGGPPDDGEGGDFGFGEFLAGIDALLMGRSTYEFLAPFEEWPYQGKPVHVLSTTLEVGADPRITVHRSLDEALGWAAQEVARSTSREVRRASPSSAAPNSACAQSGSTGSIDGGRGVHCDMVASWRSKVLTIIRPRTRCGKC